MKLTRIFRLPLALLGVGILFFGFQSCNEPDIRLVNKVKTFDPKWSSLNDKLGYLDRNLDLAEDKFEKDFGEVEGLLTEIADSLKGRNYRKMLKGYDSLMVHRDTIRAVYTMNKAEHGKTVSQYQVWEKMVMNAEVNPEAGHEQLKEFKAIHKRLDHSTDSVTTELRVLFDEHNTILKDLTRMMGVFQNFDIRMQ